VIIIERGVGHMGMARSLDVFVDGSKVGALKQHERVMVDREAGVHEIFAVIDDAHSPLVRVRSHAERETRVLVTLYPKLGLRNLIRRSPDAWLIEVSPPADRA